MKKVIKGNRVNLRPISESDTDNIVRWRNKKIVQDNFIFREKFTPEMHNHWLNSKVKSGEVIQYIMLDEIGKPFGSVYYRDIDPISKTAEFGIFIGEEDHISKGYGQEVMRLFIDFGINELGLMKIDLRVIESNDRAYHMYEKMGFKVISRQQQISQPSGEILKVVHMSLIAK